MTTQGPAIDLPQGFNCCMSRVHLLLAYPVCLFSFPPLYLARPLNPMADCVSIVLACLPPCTPKSAAPALAQSFPRVPNFALRLLAFDSIQVPPMISQQATGFSAHLSMLRLASLGFFAENSARNHYECPFYQILGSLGVLCT